MSEPVYKIATTFDASDEWLAEMNQLVPPTDLKLLDKWLGAINACFQPDPHDEQRADMDLPLGAQFMSPNDIRFTAAELAKMNAAKMTVADQALVIRPGDTLVIRIATDTSMAAVAAIRAGLERFPDVKTVVIIADGMAVYRPEGES